MAIRRFGPVLAGLVALLMLFPLPADAAGDAATDSVLVRFKPDACASFVQVVHLVVGTRAVSPEGSAWRFTVGARGTRDDWARLFATLPSVHEVTPKVALTDAPAPDYLEGEMLVKFKAGVTDAQIAALNARWGVTIADRLSGIDVYRLKLAPGQEVPAMCREYEASGLVQYAEPNHRVTISMPVAPPSATGIRVRYAVGANPELLNLVFGTRTVGPDVEGTTRLVPPAGVSANAEARVLSLCPAIAEASPAP